MLVNKFSTYHFINKYFSVLWGYNALFADIMKLLGHTCSFQFLNQVPSFLCYANVFRINVSSAT